MVNDLAILRRKANRFAHIQVSHRLRRVPCLTMVKIGLKWPRYDPKAIPLLSQRDFASFRLEGEACMIIGLRIALALLGVLYVGVGMQFLLDPVSMGGDFGLQPIGNGGLSTIRADMTSFFWVSAGAMLLGAWKQRGEVLYVTAALMGIVFAARCLSLALDGTYEGWLPPMAFEAVTVALCLMGARVMRAP